MSILCSMVGATFVSAAAEVIRRKLGVTAAFNAQVDTAQSKFGGASLLLDGAGDALYVTPTTDMVWGTSSNFTYECWARFASTAASYIFDQRTAFGTASVALLYDATGLDYYQGGTRRINYVWTPTLNVWYHIALVRNNGTTTLYVDGVNRGSFSDTLDYVQGNSTLVVGGWWNASSTASGFNGWLDEVRVSKSARYTTGFTPPTTPFVNDSNTVLLLHCDGTDASTYFEDDNGLRSKNGVSASGNAQLSTAQFKFGRSSALFDGTTDYLTIKTKSDFEFSATSTFTIECWLRTTAVNNSVQLLTKYTPSGSFNGWGFEISPNNSKLEFWDGVAWRAFNNATLTTNTWHHAAVVCNAGSCKMYFNGTEQTTTFTLTSSIVNTTTDLFIGARADGLFSFTGNLDEIRISNSVRYTGNFTPSTTPFVNDSNTVLLLHMNGTNATTVFLDDNGTGRSSIGMYANGDAQLTTSNPKFGGACALFDGTGDQIILEPSESFTYGTGDFTVEFWVRFSSLAANIVLWDQRTASTSDQIMIGYSTTSFLYLFVGGSNRITGNSLSTNTWYHIAVTRSGTSTKMFVDGTQVGSTWTDTTNYASKTNFGPYIGSSITPDQYLNGRIDEVRVSKGIARYTANFTAPTAPFQNDSNTSVLIHFDGTNASKTFVDDNGTTPS